MSLKIAQLGQPVLRRIAQPLPPESILSPEFQQFLDQMHDTLRESGGVGLAAPQVFVSLRVFLAVTRVAENEDDHPEPNVLINPTLTPLHDEKVPGWEGCLSFPELLVLVPRSRSVRVDYLDRSGAPQSLTLEGFPARVVQHEFDHLEGILTLDRAASTHDIVKASEIDAVREDRARPAS
jgi:peptide deformylase